MFKVRPCPSICPIFPERIDRQNFVELVQLLNNLILHTFFHIRYKSSNVLYIKDKGKKSQQTITFFFFCISLKNKFYSFNLLFYLPGKYYKK